MLDEIFLLLHQSHTLHPHPDLVQVTYELLRRLRVDGYSIAQATMLFALSRLTFYAAQAAWEQAGIAGLSSKQ